MDHHLLQLRLKHHLDFIYPNINHQRYIDDLLNAMALTGEETPPLPHTNNWSEKDVYVISYGDSFVSDHQAPLANLDHFLNHYLADSVSGVHILPFYPFSSDDGFSVIDYYQVNSSCGDWNNINNIAVNFSVMADIVINHCSSRSGWFENFRQRKHPGLDFFFEASPQQDLSQVIRPRTNTLLREVNTLDGKRHVWCTFSHDQVDLDFSNPQVLLEFVKISRFYLEQNINVFRLDAVAFLWKEVGTPCINLPQTHEIIRLLRLLIEYKNPSAIIITETNIPNKENLSYFGNANEAHAIYNFALPPLLLNTLVTGNCLHLKNWLSAMPPAQPGTTFFNFIASHDGIGLRPIEGILNEREIDQLINTMVGFGGRVSWRSNQGKNKAYEINIALYDALSGTTKGPDRHQLSRFICAHAIMLAIEGIPAIYVHSLLGTQNDYEKVEHSQHNRAINRHKWHYPEIQNKLSDAHSHHHKVFKQLTHLMKVRRQQPAFHPNADQYTLHIGEHLFAFWRHDRATQQIVVCVNNVTDQFQDVIISDLNLRANTHWRDLLSDTVIDPKQGSMTLRPYQTLWLSHQQ